MKKLCILLGLFSFALLLDSCASGYWRVGGNTKMVDPDFLNTRELPSVFSKTLRDADTIFILNGIYENNDFVLQTFQEIWPSKQVSFVSPTDVWENQSPPLKKELQRKTKRRFQSKPLLIFEHDCYYKRSHYTTDYPNGMTEWKSIEFTRYYYDFSIVTNYEKFKLAKVDRFGSYEALVRPYSFTSSKFYNDLQGLKYLQLKQVITDLSNNIGRSNYEDYAKKEVLKKLAKETLYIPEYTLTKFNSFTGDESERHNEKELFSKYNFKYKVISNDELNRMVLKKEPAFILEYVKNSNHKNIKVYHTIEGLAYFRFSYNTYNLKPKDLARLTTKIKASK
jgi:hypothetical protein